MSITDFRLGRRVALSQTGGNVRVAQIVVIGGIHLAALYGMYLTEFGLFGGSLYLLAWGLLNFFWLAVLRRPGMAAALSLTIFATLIALSQFKFDVLWMTVTFLDLLIIDRDTIAFLLTIFPDLRTTNLIVALVVLPALVLIWRLDPFRIRPAAASLGGTACLAGLVGLSVVVPEQPWEPFQGVNHISSLARSGVHSVPQLMAGRWIDADATVAHRLDAIPNASCQPAGPRPHIIMVLDESSFDITAAPGIKVPPDYTRHFRSFDGRSRSLVTEAAGGPTWYTEYNVLTGLSARSFGGLMFYVTRIAAGRVERGLPQALRRCGYRTFSLYPAYGAFLNARGFQTTTGIEHFLDARAMKAGDAEPDRFYYDQASRLIERERGGAPLFVFVYTVANHFPWTTRYRPELTPDWRDLGNEATVDEYIRRQTLSASDYADFVARLEREFPDEAFLIVRFGDHPPALATRIIDPSLGDAEILRRIRMLDPRFYTTYYAIDAINFAPAELSAARETLDAPYLPLVVLEAAGLPLEPSFAEQKKILERCRGLFYRCAGGAEARRFNRLLIDAGLIKGL